MEIGRQTASQRYGTTEQDYDHGEDLRAARTEGEEGCRDGRRRGGVKDIRASKLKELKRETKKDETGIGKKGRRRGRKSIERFSQGGTTQKWRKER